MKMKAKIKQKHSTLSNIIYMLGLMYKASPWLVVGGIFEQVVSAMPGRLISVIGLKYIIDEVQSGAEPKKIITGIIIMLAVIVVCEIFSRVFYELFVHREREKMDLIIQSMFYRKAAELDIAKYDDPGYYSDFILSIENISDNLTNILSLIKGYIEHILSFLAIAAIIFTIDPVCLVIVLGAVILFIPLGKYTGNLQTKRREAVTEKHRRSDYFARVFYLPDYAGEIRTSGISPLLHKRFTESADDLIKTQKGFIRKLDGLFFIQEFSVQVVGFMLILSLYIGYQTIVTGNMGAGDFVATFNGATQIGASVLYLTVYSLRNFTERSKMIEKCRSFLAVESKIKDGAYIADCDKPETIAVKDISFTYEGSEKESINGVSFEIKPCEKLALVGYNGAGKTTLTNLLLRLYDVDSGSIEIGGRDIRDVTLASHRSRFAAVFQDFRIFGATLGVNVALSPNYDGDRVMKALEMAGFTKELPDGADTLLLREFSDEGIMLSGGEQQKLAIARVFYKQSPYIILDEPSANLDPVSEYELNRAISESCTDSTVIFISHRLSTTRHADRILMLENGRVIECGSHDELMAQNGKYAYMFRLQAEKYKES